MKNNKTTKRVLLSGMLRQLYCDLSIFQSIK